ncbi:MAG: exo-alpha-sialidase [Planctomycetia bacterium]|nr:exo-alpha-sialidase [Planctomycetia bacterium]
MDLIVSRSSDLGKTWSKPQMIHGGFKYACGNPCPIVDRDNGTVWLLFARNNNKQIMVTHSKDDGVTWAEPKAVTEESKPEEKNGWQATGPNQGIQLTSGRLLAPANAGGRSFCFYSDDHGTTWKRGEPIDTPSSECVAVELMDGSVVLNVRDKRQRKEIKSRAYAISKDGGQTWSKAEIHPQLLGPECNHCQVRLSDEKQHDKNRLLHSGPMGPDGRKNLALYLSYDEAKTWQQTKVVHSGRDVSYTGLVVLPDQSIGMLYATNSTGWQSIWFARFTLEWLTDGKDRVVPGDAKK